MGKTACMQISTRLKGVGPGQYRHRWITDQVGATVTSIGHRHCRFVISARWIAGSCKCVTWRQPSIYWGRPATVTLLPPHGSKMMIDLPLTPPRVLKAPSNPPCVVFPPLMTSFAGQQWLANFRMHRRTRNLTCGKLRPLLH